MARVDRNVARLVLIAAALFAVLAIASSGDAVPVWRDPPPAEGGERRPSATRAEQEVAPTTTEPPEEVGEPGDLRWLMHAAIALTVILVVLVLWSLVTTFPGWRARRGRPRLLAPERAEALPAEVPDVVLDERAQLDALHEGSPRNAIVACWLQMEADVAGAGVPRRQSETSTEYTTRVLELTPLDPSPVHDLAALYREARFSRHDLGEAHRERAIAAVRAIHASLATVTATGWPAPGADGTGRG